MIGATWANSRPGSRWRSPARAASVEAAQIIAPVVKFQRESRRQEPRRLWQTVELAAALYAQALTDRQAEARRLLREAAAKIELCPPRCASAARRTAMARAHPRGGARRWGGPRGSPLFSSSGQRGYSALISADPRRVFARKLEREIDVKLHAGRLHGENFRRVGARGTRRCHRHRYRRRTLARIACALCRQISARAANRRRRVWAICQACPIEFWRCR